MKKSLLFCLVLALLGFAGSAWSAEPASVPAASAAPSATPAGASGTPASLAAPDLSWLSQLGTPKPIFLTCCTFTAADCRQYCFDQSGPNCVSTYRCFTNCTYSCQCGTPSHPCL